MMTRASTSGLADRFGLTSRLHFALIVPLAAALVLPGWIAMAKGGGMQHKTNKDFRELIVKGERPEIAACMVAAIDYARHDTAFSAIRWDNNASDRAVMTENEVNGQLMRFIRLPTEMRTRNSTIFHEIWQPVEISCEQPEDGTIQVHVTPTVG